ncbi:MAG: pseudouridine synthase [Ignavibacteriales bacterium]|nr:pseudouridine synthase [Ignavibacteriales bacterium]
MKQTNKKYFILNKPYGVLSQFTDKENRLTLSSFHNFPTDVYPVGRLDMDSEGLLIITNDKQLTDFLLNPENKHEREYFVQVEGIPSENDLQKLRVGIVLKDGLTLPVKAKIIDKPDFPARVPPVRKRKKIPTSWFSLSLIEGRNRQVRRMTAAIGFPTLRLVRVRIKNLLLGDLGAGTVRELTSSEIEKLKKYPPPERRIKI